MIDKEVEAKIASMRDGYMSAPLNFRPTFTRTCATCTHFYDNDGRSRAHCSVYSGNIYVWPRMSEVMICDRFRYSHTANTLAKEVVVVVAAKQNCD